MRATNVILRHFPYIHSPLQELPEFSIMRNSKKGLFSSYPTRGKEGHPCAPNKKNLLKLSPSFPHWVIGLESLSGDSFGNSKIKSTLSII